MQDEEGSLMNHLLPMILDDLEERAQKTSAGTSRIYNPGWHQALEKLMEKVTCQLK